MAAGAAFILMRMEDITENKIRKWVFEATEECLMRWFASQSYQNKERLTKNEAIAFLKDCGYETTISKLHKLSATGEIPSSKINGKLSFLKADLQEWAKRQIEYDVSLSNAAILLAESARRKDRSEALKS